MGIPSPMLRPTARLTLYTRIRGFANRSHPLSAWKCKALDYPAHEGIPEAREGGGGLVRHHGEVDG